MDAPVPTPMSDVAPRPRRQLFCLYQSVRRRSSRLHPALLPFRINQLCPAALLVCLGLVPALLCLKQSGVLGFSMSEKGLLSEQAVILDKKVPAVLLFILITATTFPLSINDCRGKPELMSLFYCNSFSKEVQLNCSLFFYVANRIIHIYSNMTVNVKGFHELN